MRPILSAGLLGLALAARAPALDEGTVFDQVRVRANQLSLVRDASYDEQGRLARSGVRFQINLIVDVGSLPAMGYSEVMLDEVVTDSGETLRLVSDRGRQEGQLQTAGRSGSTTFGLYFNLTPPQRPCEALREVQGSLRLTVAEGKLKRSTLEPVLRWTNEVAQIDGVAGGTVALARDADDRIRVNVSAPLRELMTEVRFLAADGSELRMQQYGSSSDGNGFSFIYRGKLADDAKAVVYFYESRRSVLVPFTVQNVAFPGPKPPAEQATVPSEDAENGQDPATEAPVRSTP